MRRVYKISSCKEHGGINKVYENGISCVWMWVTNAQHDLDLGNEESGPSVVWRHAPTKGLTNAYLLLDLLWLPPRWLYLFYFFRFCSCICRLPTFSNHVECYLSVSSLCHHCEAFLNVSDHYWIVFLTVSQRHLFRSCQNSTTQFRVLVPCAFWGQDYAGSAWCAFSWRRHGPGHVERLHSGYSIQMDKGVDG